jgi:hypothetical protein
VGAAGDEEFGREFQTSADRLEKLARDNDVDCIRIGAPGSDGPDDLSLLKDAISNQASQHPEPLWIVMFGHGTFDGRSAKFNLRGPDLSAQQLQQWLSPFQRTVVVVNCASASSPFMNTLAGENRVIVTATKSGYQYNFARFGQYLSKALGAPEADLDKDGQTSLLEAYLLASSGVQQFYQEESRLATEEALLDDNGDGRGTPAGWFRGVRVVKSSKDQTPADGTRAHQLHLVRSERENRMPAEQRAQRDALEEQVEALRTQKSELGEDQYYEQLLPIMVKLARLYHRPAADN